MRIRADSVVSTKLLPQSMFKHLGAEPHADPETGAYVRVDMDFHCEPPDTASNSKLM